MKAVKRNKYLELIQAATVLAQDRHSLNDWSLGEVANEARIPLGNMYYYFKTKEGLQEEIARSIIPHVEIVSKDGSMKQVVDIGMLNNTSLEDLKLSIECELFIRRRKEDD